MTQVDKDFDFSQLTAAERITLARELCDSVHDEIVTSLTAAHRAELDRRLAELESGKVQGIPWAAVRDTLRTRW